jgi:hypothetical protein
MAQQLSGAHKARITNVLDVLGDLLAEPHRPIAAAALGFCVDELAQMTTPTPAPATAANSTAPPAATEGASKTEHPPAPPIRAHSHYAAVKAAATRKANKTKAAGNGNLADAGQKVRAASGANDTTE